MLEKDIQATQGARQDECRAEARGHLQDLEHEFLGLWRLAALDELAGVGLGQRQRFNGGKDDA
eukprot:2480851-Alexandrium_andersonii.AAC.1